MKHLLGIIACVIGLCWLSWWYGHTTKYERDNYMEKKSASFVMTLGEQSDSLGGSGGEITFKASPQFELIEMEVTAYCPCEKCCGRWSDGFTAAIIKIDSSVSPSKFVAAPKEYDFWTLLDIPGYGIVPVLDRGGAIKGNKLDVFFPTHQEALNWGRQTLKVKVLK